MNSAKELRKAKSSLGTRKWNAIRLARKHGKMKTSVKGTKSKLVSTRVSKICGEIGLLDPRILTSALQSSKW